MANFQKGGLFLIFLHLFTCGKTQTEILISPEVNQQQYPHKQKGCRQTIKTDDQTASSLKEFKNNMIEVKTLFTGSDLIRLLYTQPFQIQEVYSFRKLLTYHKVPASVSEVCTQSFQPDSLIQTDISVRLSHA